ncbi:diacylglycerol kinase [Xylanimonas oleitrophica]|uniref:Diacylglycerol kinase n=1 Tax=Xylanimonas oleitrophica TaxID=2607479 RepID=A0A2W5WZK4_9MICO|nr:diacylglycerol kinase family protein [Xylanimonas oleitrophica]PZR53355.1 diacylglycerol kinase [Xylanimonas oleitrophica]
MSWELWLAIAAVVMAGAALALTLAQWQRARQAGVPAPPEAEEETEVPTGEQIAVVINPSKEGVEQLVDTVRRVCRQAALPPPRFYETTVEDPGVGQAREALAAGADLVVAAGGDGTVRAVASAMVGSDVPMGLLPAGTGNLLARNLDIPVTSVAEAMAVVLGGRDRRIDVGWARILEHAPEEEPRARQVESRHDFPRQEAGRAEELPGPPTEGEPPVRPGDEDAPVPGTVEDSAGEKEIFLVIAGLGFDAAMVADTDDDLKRRVGWLAYFVSGVRHLHGRRLRAQVQLDDAEPTTHRLRTVMVGNCGRLPGGVTLLPDAVIDDGELDVAAIDTRGGVVGWAQLMGEVVLQGVGMRNELPGKIGRIDHARARRARIRVEGGEQAQVDGDPMGRVVEMEAWVEPGALLVRAV